MTKISPFRNVFTWFDWRDHRGAHFRIWTVQIRRLAPKSGIMVWSTANVLRLKGRSFPFKVCISKYERRSYPAGDSS
jgi:hypothetical protein